MRDANGLLRLQLNYGNRAVTRLLGHAQTPDASTVSGIRIQRLIPPRAGAQLLEQPQKQGTTNAPQDRQPHLPIPGLPVPETLTPEEAQARLDEATRQLKSPDPNARLGALNTLVDLDVPEARETIRGALSDPHPVVRFTAAFVLWGRDDADGRSTLREGLLGGPVEARIWAVTFIGQLGIVGKLEGDEETARDLASLALDAEEPLPLRQVALRALWFVRGDASRQALRTVLGNKREPTELRMLAAVGFFLDEQGMTILREVLEQGDPEGRILAAYVLSLKDPSYVRALAEIVEERQLPIELRSLAIVFLGDLIREVGISSGYEVDVLRKMAHDRKEDRSLRKDAKRQLKQLQ